MQETVEDGPFFCFQGVDSEVNLAKIIQTEVTFENGAKSICKNAKNGAKYNNNN